jgi:cytochrome c peroxidase
MGDAMSRVPRQFIFVVLVGSVACGDDATEQPSDVVEGTIETLGASLFFDETLSIGENQSCAACHADDVGWTGPDEDLNAHGAVYEGSSSGRFGNRKPPSSAYASFAPSLTIDDEGTVVGGNFLDGRATGWRLGEPILDQAQGPFLNPLEQALPDAAALVERVCSSDIAPLFRRIWGEAACNDVDLAFANIARSVAAFEGSPAMSPFTSKFDAVLAGTAELDPDELRGLELFRNKAKCARCHTLEPAPDAGAPLLTDFTFDNLGVPRNPENPFYRMDEQFIDGAPINPQGDDFVDLGLGGFLAELAAGDAWRQEPFVTDAFLSRTSEEIRELAERTRGMHRVPTLRNVAKSPRAGFVKAYSHNGYFKSLESLVHFYNTRDVLPRCDGTPIEAEALARGCWPAPEVAENVNRDEMGDLGLSPDEEAAVVAFLGTLSDRAE